MIKWSPFFPACLRIYICVCISPVDHIRPLCASPVDATEGPIMGIRTGGPVAVVSL